MNSDFYLIFEKTGYILFLAALGLAVFQVIRSDRDPEEVIFSSALGLVALYFYKDIFALSTSLSHELALAIRDSGSERSVWDFIDATWESIRKLEVDPITATRMMLFKGGLWAALSEVVQVLFLFVTYLLEVAQQVLLSLLLVIFPILAGLAPTSLSPVRSGIKYLIELCLWVPSIRLIEKIIATLTYGEMNRPIDGYLTGLEPVLKMVSVEVIYILLMLSIPSLVSQIVEGSFSSDFGVGPSHFYSAVKRKALFFSGILKAKL